MHVQNEDETKEKFVLRVENTFKGNQFIKSLKKNLNKNTYNIRVRYSGKRPPGTSQVSTRKENATSMRVYITDTEGEQATRTRYYDLLKAYRDLAKRV